LSACVLCSAEVEPARDLLWRKDGHDIVRCPACGLVSRADVPDERALAGIYDDGYFRDDPESDDRHGYSDYLRDEPLHRANARRRLDLLARHLPAPGRLLDVGCAAGFFVDEARRAGWDAAGVDVSAPMVEWARSELGLPVIQGTFADADVAPELDAVTMWDYIEHSVDPRRDLEQARDRLVAGGALALSTGDIGSAVARVTGRRWHLLTPEHHNFFFDERTLRRLLADTGFRVVEARRRAALYSVSHVVYKLETLAPLPALRRGAARVGGSRLGSAGLPLNLFDIVTVVARRR
jgi:SAM-dependent methyltransferase